MRVIVFPVRDDSDFKCLRRSFRILMCIDVLVDIVGAYPVVNYLFDTNVHVVYKGTQDPIFNQPLTDL